MCGRFAAFLLYLISLLEGFKIELTRCNHTRYSSKSAWFDLFLINRRLLVQPHQLLKSYEMLGKVLTKNLTRTCSDNFQHALQTLLVNSFWTNLLYKTFTTYSFLIYLSNGLVFLLNTFLNLYAVQLNYSDLVIEPEINYCKTLVYRLCL